MINDFDLIIERLNELKKEILSKWGIMSSFK